jgi:hypothetical protein
VSLGISQPPAPHRPVNAGQGASIAISINLLFAGLLAFVVPHLINTINYSGTLGLFAGFNLVALVSVFQETGGIRLDALGFVFRERKRDFVHFQVFRFLPWLGTFLVGRESLASRPRRLIDFERVDTETHPGQPGASDSETSVRNEDIRVPSPMA